MSNSGSWIYPSASCRDGDHTSVSTNGRWPIGRVGNCVEIMVHGGGVPRKLDAEIVCDRDGSGEFGGGSRELHFWCRETVGDWQELVGKWIHVCDVDHGG
jgi:hypothetical protein